MLEAHHKMKLFYPIRPWENEPDHAEWVQEPSGYKCRIVRQELTGSLCGYVGIPKGHRFWGMGHNEDIDDLYDISNHVHGGLTFSGANADGFWYFGFDTNHANDFAPKMVEHWIDIGRSDVGALTDCVKYKTWEFVEYEIYWLGKRLWQYNE